MKSNAMPHTVSNSTLQLSSYIWLWAGFILVSLNLRLIFASVGPVLKNLELGMTSTLLLTTLPPALLGVFAIPGAYFRRWLGEERSLGIALALLTAGCGIRWFGESALIAGTIIGSAGIAVMNVIMPALARKRFAPSRIGMVMGIYALMLGMGALLGAGGAFPLFSWMGADTEAAYHSLGLWAIPALLAFVIWLPQIRHPALDVSHTTTSTAVRVYRNRTAWSITLFFGLQALNLYVFLSWMPSLLVDRGATQASAAMIFSVSQASLMIGSFVTPLLAARKPDQQIWIVTVVLTCLMGTLGLVYAPSDTALLWAILLGWGQGAGPALGAFLFVAKASSVDTATRISGMAQTVGYLIAMAGPLLVGAMYHYIGSWNAIGIVLAGLLVLELVVSLPAGKNVRI